MYIYVHCRKDDSLFVKREKKLQNGAVIGCIEVKNYIHIKFPQFSGIHFPFLNTSAVGMEGGKSFLPGIGKLIT